MTLTLCNATVICDLLCQYFWDNMLMWVCGHVWRQASCDDVNVRTGRRNGKRSEDLAKRSAGTAKRRTVLASGCQGRRIVPSGGMRHKPSPLLGVRYMKTGSDQWKTRERKQTCPIFLPHFFIHLAFLLSFLKAEILFKCNRNISNVKKEIKSLKNLAVIFLDRLRSKQRWCSSLTVHDLNGTQDRLAVGQ